MVILTGIITSLFIFPFNLPFTSADVNTKMVIAAVGLDHNPCTGVHSDDAVVFGSDRVFLDQTVHRTALCLRKSGRLVGVGRLCKCIDRLRGKCAIKYLGIADSLNTQRKRIFPVIFTQALKRLVHDDQRKKRLRHRSAVSFVRFGPRCFFTRHFRVCRSDRKLRCTCQSVRRIRHEQTYCFGDSRAYRDRPRFRELRHSV